MYKYIIYIQKTGKLTKQITILGNIKMNISKIPSENSLLMGHVQELYVEILIDALRGNII